MKTLRLFKVVTFFITVVLSFSSCAPTDDNELNPITKFVGTWSVNDQAARLNYEVTIDYNPLNSAEVVLKNFADLGNSAVGLVVGNTIVIDSQVLSGDNSVSGSGSYINENKLSFNYQLDNGIDTESRVAIFSK
ncbi:MAG: hypothetical protein CVT99_08160 [Bacteroidetes bacterium HGW-Bacteroidetes-16]|jgi:hypothetical protein|nr:MAG: hypothetical protein CVT99_08160 [Bacteroidetes bacterium HGW-Bacteroidetes-16]